MVLHIGCYVVRDEEGIEEVVTREPTCSGQVRGWSVMVGHVNSDVASIQDGDSPAYYECAIVHTSGPGVFRRPRALHTDTQISLASRPDLE